MITDDEFSQWTLECLRGSWENCKRCDLHYERHNVVMGEGKSTATTMVIGEAPREMEDKSGRNMMGPEGRIFRLLAKASGWPVEQCAFMTNTVSCRIPGDRKPRKGNKEACLPRLRSEVTAVQPVVLVLLGSTALRLCEGLGGSPRLRDHRGKIPRENWPWEILGNGGSRNLILVYATYHPSWIGRQTTRLKKEEALTEIKNDLFKIAPVIRLASQRRGLIP